MTNLSYSKKAKLDFLSIWAYIAEDSPNAADKLLDTLNEKCVLLAKNAKLGQARRDIAPELRYFPVKNYLILYKELDFGVEIIRILHGSRDLSTIFQVED